MVRNIQGKRSTKLSSSRLCNVIEVLANIMVVIILQYIVNESYPHIVNLKLVKFYVNTFWRTPLSSRVI